MLSNLRGSISTLLSPKMCVGERSASRTLVALAGESLGPVRDRFSNCFASFNPGVEVLYPWIDLSNNEAADSKSVVASIRSAFDAKRVAAIIEKGIKVLPAMDQIILVGDLCESDSLERIACGCKVLSSAYREFDKNLQPFMTGIFVSRRAGGFENPQGERFQERFEDTVLKSGVFERVFLIDAMNSANSLLSDPLDQFDLLAHLIYFLEVYPQGPSVSSDGFSNWLKGGDTREGYVSGFSAMSVSLPIDRILELVAVQKGASVMRHSFLSEPLPTRFQLYKDRFLQRGFLVDLNDVSKILYDAPEVPKRNPISEVPEYLVSQYKDYLETVSAVDASLPGVAAEIGARMEMVAKKKIVETSLLLDEFLESIISTENGGLLIAKEFLKKLVEHIEGIVPKEVPKSVYSDTTFSINKMKDLIESGPRMEALYGRGVASGIAAGVAAASLPLTAEFGLALTVLASGSGVGLAKIVAMSFEERCNKCLVEMNLSLEKKWNSLLATEKIRVGKIYLDGVLPKIVEAQKSVDDAIARIEEIVEFFIKKYSPPALDEATFWRYVVKSREEFLAFLPKCLVREDLVAREYLKDDKPLELWRRLTSPGSAAEPSEWEWAVLEKAAQRVLPSCVPLVNTHILSCLDENEKKVGSVCDGIKANAVPFIRLKPERSSNPQTNAWLETEQTDRSEGLARIRLTLEESFPLSKMDERSPYRLSFFSFSDGIKLPDVQFGGRS